MPAFEDQLAALQAALAAGGGRIRPGTEGIAQALGALGQAYVRQAGQRYDTPRPRFTPDRPRPHMTTQPSRVPPGRAVSAARSQRWEHSPVWPQGAVRPQTGTTRGRTSQGTPPTRRYYR